MRNDHWQSFYSSPASDRVPLEESSFARWVTDRLDGHPPMVDVGTGTARDARFFAMKTHEVVGIDYSAAAVESATRRSELDGWGARFQVVDLSDARSVAGFAAGLDWSRGWNLYARFLVHAITDEARGNLWTLLAQVVEAGGEGWLEFRTDKDAAAEKVFGEHYRQYLPVDQVAEELAARGLRVVEQIESQGLAPHRDEDPWVARLRVGRAG
ncbi:class I SAM-dependent methyltransferase [Blastococcus sp. TF02A-35]|uniref:class I SAM-dependent methyltransferase n=1 Tax=Blastococcus sp. TF02A-35 TaxID=2559612 RepID=UPI0010749897|nr:class I SAM-dependent methyltransferase [Blastococcus sp. TF02A_35]TFV53586.1 class I SAM-dependent methyltransferase [Blastococcus sp. TF02A_35]